MATIVLGKHIPISILDPGTKIASKRNMQSRTFFEWRNKGFALLHRVPGAPSEPPRVLEFFEELAEYHRPENVYDMVYRPSYNVRSFTAGLGVIADPKEPFTSENDFVIHFRGMELALPSAERSLVEKWRTQSPFHLPGVSTYRPDCLLMGPSAAAFVSSTDAPVTDSVLRKFANDAHFVYFATQRTSDQRLAGLWKPFFERPVHLYFGVTSVPAAAQLETARAAGVKLLLKQGLRFAMLR